MKLQDPKYNFQDGRVINRGTGEAIPLDEPVMVFRARDRRVISAIEAYQLEIRNQEHFEAVQARREDFEAFAREHPDRMKEPDTGPNER